MSVRTRFAPSPTGSMHIGNLRSALFAYLFAKKHDGTFILRIEDTDRERFVEGGVESIISSLDWVGMSIDEGVCSDTGGAITQKGDNGPYIQSERRAIYKKYVDDLLASGHAYYAFDTSEELDEMRKTQMELKQPTGYSRTRMTNQFTLSEEEVQKRLDSGAPHVVRLQVPDNETITFTDLVRGEISVHTSEVDDQILMKSDGYPTYHLACVVDDHAMEISHVIRAEEWISSTPKHILLYQAFGWAIPEFAHLPMLVNEKKQKLSKRKGAVSVEEFRAQGYLPEALINFIAFLGWNPGTDKEMYTMDELINDFSLEQVAKSAAVFNQEKLDWFNGAYIRNMELSELTKQCVPFLQNAGLLASADDFDSAWLEQVIALEQERAKTLADFPQSLGFVFAEELEYDPALLVWKKDTKEGSKQKLAFLHKHIHEISEEEWSLEALETSIRSWIEKQGFGVGDVLWPMRVALSGQKNSPGPFEIAAVLGKEKTLERIEKAVELL